MSTNETTTNRCWSCGAHNRGTWCNVCGQHEAGPTDSPAFLEACGTKTPVAQLREESEGDLRYQINGLGKSVNWPDSLTKAIMEATSNWATDASPQDLILFLNSIPVSCD